jgi:hypothetical protein
VFEFTEIQLAPEGKLPYIRITKRTPMRFSSPREVAGAVSRSRGRIFTLKSAASSDPKIDRAQSAAPERRPTQTKLSNTSKFELTDASARVKCAWFSPQASNWA